MKFWYFLFLLFPCYIDQNGPKSKITLTLSPPPYNSPYVYIVKNHSCTNSFSKCDFWAEFKLFDPTKEENLNRYQINTHIHISIELRPPNIFHLQIEDASHSHFRSGHASSTSSKRTTKSKFLSDYRFFVNLDPFNVKVFRKETMEVVFAFSHLDFLFADKLVQFKVFKPENPYIYGLGQRFGSFQMNEEVYTIWNQDNPENTENPFLNAYGSHPVYLAREESLNYHILFLRNINAMQITLTSQNVLEYKLMGGIIDLSLIFGDRYPDTAIRSYHALIGGITLHPFWSMGFFQSRFGSKNFKEIVQIVEEYKQAKIPLDGIFLDLEYMKHRSSFTIDRDSYDPRLIKEIKKKYKLKIVPIIDPLINAEAAQENWVNDDRNYFLSTICEKDASRIGLKYDVFLKHPDGNHYFGKQWVENGYIPDFTHPNSTNFYEEMLFCLHDVIPFDGIWLDMNEVSLYETERNIDFFPFVPETLYNGPMFNTIDTETVHFNGEREIDVHNLYAYHQANATREVLKKLFQTSFPFILSRGNVFGMGAIAQHWSGDNTASFNSLTTSLSLLFSMALFGLPMTGSDICGHNQHTTPLLCARWIQLGAFYPFSRNHNNDRSGSQHFTFLGEIVKNSARSNLAFRYTLLKHIYSLFLEEKRGGTVIKPLFFVFPEFEGGLERNVLERQMMVGSMIMIGVMGEEEVREFWLPEGVRWYYVNGRRWVGERVRVRNEAGELAPVFVRKGSVVMRQRWEEGTLEDLGERFKMNVFFEMEQGREEGGGRREEEGGRTEDGVGRRKEGGGSRKEEKEHEEVHMHMQAQGMVSGIGDLREQNVEKYCWKEEDDCLVDFYVTARLSELGFHLSIRFKWRDNRIPERIRKDGEKFISIEQINLYGLSLTNTVLGLNLLIDGERKSKVRMVKAKQGKCWQVRLESPVVIDGDGEIELVV